MDDPYLRGGGGGGGYPRGDPHPHFHERTTSFFIAVPFVVCFSLFGLLNLVGGTVLTVMSCKPKFGPKALASLQRLVKNFKLEPPQHIDPMRVVGIMLLVTGSLLVVIGLALGVTACRSISEHKRKRRRQQLTSTSGMLPLYSLVDRRRTSASLTSSPSFVVSSRRSNGKKRSLEKTVSPILEASGEYESLECERLAVEIHHASNTSVRNISPSVSAEVVCHAEMSTEPINQTGFELETVCQSSLSTRAIYQTSLSPQAICQSSLSTPAICQSSLSTQAICQSSLTTQGICQTSLSTLGICHTSLSTHGICETSLSTEDVCRAGSSAEAVGPEGAMVDSDGQANLLTNFVLPVNSSTESSCRPRLSFPRSRFKFNSDEMIPYETSASVEITVVDVEHEMANFTTADDTGSSVRDP